MILLTLSLKTQCALHWSLPLASGIVIGKGFSLESEADCVCTVPFPHSASLSRRGTGGMGRRRGKWSIDGREREMNLLLTLTDDHSYCYWLSILLCSWYMRPKGRKGGGRVERGDTWLGGNDRLCELINGDFEKLPEGSKLHFALNLSCDCCVKRLIVACDQSDWKTVWTLAGRNIWRSEKREGETIEMNVLF